MKNNVARILVVLSVAGCSSGSGSVPAAAPFFYNGNYYMAGDNSCKQVNQMSAGRVMCTSSAGEKTGYRDAMNDQQIQMYQHNQQIELIQKQQEREESERSSAKIQAWANSIPQPNYPQFSAPQVAPLSLPGSGHVACINTGMVTNCRY